MKKLLGILVLGLLLTSGISYSDETKKIIKNCADRRSEASTGEMVEELVVLQVQYHEAWTTAADRLVKLKNTWNANKNLVDPDLGISVSEDKLKIEKQINELENQINKLDESYEKNKKLIEEEYKKNWEIEYNQVLKHCKNEYEKSPETFKSRWKNK